MPLEFPYQIVTFLDKEPKVGEPVYNGENGWYPQLTLKRRFALRGISEGDLVSKLRTFFTSRELPVIACGTLMKPERMPVRVIDVTNQNDLQTLHHALIHTLEEVIISRYPERDGPNYYPHITAEYYDRFVIPVEKYSNKTFVMKNVWIIKDEDDEDSQAFVKLL